VTINITMTGNLTADPELRFLPTGTATCNFQVAHNNQKFNKKTERWENADTIYMRCAAWKTLAEQVAESFHKGDAVIVVGKLRLNQWETREGEKRENLELVADDVAASVRAAVVKVQRVSRQSQGQPASRPQGRAAEEPLDPWASQTGPGDITDGPPF